MTHHLKQHREGFPFGRTQLTAERDETGIAFSIVKLKAGESLTVNTKMETAVLHLEGDVTFTVEGNTYRNQRSSLYEQQPFALHAPAQQQVKIEAHTDAECALFETSNEKSFPLVVYPPEKTANEHRGKGLVEDTSLRYVRTIFDGSHSHPNTELVLGEVVNFPGRWSSYPPHHHPQPEIYHYRFSKPQGYGHAELGDDVMKVRQYDTVKILGELDHAQCSAPGYAMYYIWVIRHLPDNRYTVPEFTEEHLWTIGG